MLPVSPAVMPEGWPLLGHLHRARLPRRDRISDSRPVSATRSGWSRGRRRNSTTTYYDRAVSA